MQHTHIIVEMQIIAANMNIDVVTMNTTDLKLHRDMTFVTYFFVQKHSLRKHEKWWSKLVQK